MKLMIDQIRSIIFEKSGPLLETSYKITLNDFGHDVSVILVAGIVPTMIKQIYEHFLQ